MFCTHGLPPPPFPLVTVPCLSGCLALKGGWDLGLHLGQALGVWVDPHLEVLCPGGWRWGLLSVGSDSCGLQGTEGSKVLLPVPSTFSVGFLEQTPAGGSGQPAPTPGALAGDTRALTPAFPREQRGGGSIQLLWAGLFHGPIAFRKGWVTPQQFLLPGVELIRTLNLRQIPSHLLICVLFGNGTPLGSGHLWALTASPPPSGPDGRPVLSCLVPARRVCLGSLAPAGKYK